MADRNAVDSILHQQEARLSRIRNSPLATAVPAELTLGRRRAQRLSPKLTRHNPLMIRRRLPSHLVLWAAICSLLLNAASPLLALGAAQARGVPLADVCSVFGVRLPGAMPVTRAVDAAHLASGLDPDRDGSHTDKSHSVDHCALTALAAVAMPDAESPSVWLVDSAPGCIPIQFSRDIGDAAARWATRLHHGPPVFV